MHATSAIRLFTLAALAGVVVLTGGLPAPAAAAAPAVASSVPASSPVPGLGSTTEVCTRSRWLTTPGSAGECARWSRSGPVNVVLLSSGSETPYEDTITYTRPRWRPAVGDWLVARLPTHGCGPAFHASGQQVELRINPVSRRHFKFIQTGCKWHGYDVTVGEAHTDLYDVKHCGGDRMTDLDVARDALVQSLVAGGIAGRVEYRSWRAPGSTYPAGCGRQVATDGRVAVVWLNG